VLVAGPGTDSQSALDDAVATARYAYNLARGVGVTADLNLHPYYPSARGRARFPGHPRCALPTLVAAVRAIDALRHELMPSSGLFIGWQDEGHDQQPEVRQRELKAARNAFDRFNRTQEGSVLDPLA
jgi:hypothetical protein